MAVNSAHKFSTKLKYFSIYDSLSISYFCNGLVTLDMLYL
jgi:hypothetical protein